MAKNEKITYEVKRTLGVLSESEYDRKNWQTKELEHIRETKELREVSWNGATPKIEIRSWYKNTETNEETCGKGVTLSEEELASLRFLLEGMDESLDHAE